MMNGHWRSRIIFLAALMLASILLCLIMALISPGTLDLYHSLLLMTLAAVAFAAVYAYRSQLTNIFITLGLFVGSLIFLPTTDYIFNSILKQHQRDRILSFPRNHQRPPGHRLQRQPGQNRHRIRRLRRKGGSSRVRRSNTDSSPKSTPTSSSAPLAKSGDSSEQPSSSCCSVC